MTYAEVHQRHGQSRSRNDARMSLDLTPKFFFGYFSLPQLYLPEVHKPFRLPFFPPMCDTMRWPTCILCSIVGRPLSFTTVELLLTNPFIGAIGASSETNRVETHQA